MKKTKLISLVLIGALFSAPFSAKAPEPKVIEWLTDLCSFEAVGSFIFICESVRKIWFNPPQWHGDISEPPPEPIDPGDGEPGSPGDNNDDNNWSGLSLPKVASCPVSGSSQYTNQLFFTMQATADFVTWTNAYSFNVWESPQGRLLLVSNAQGLSISTNFATMGAQGVSTNRWTPPLISLSEPKMFYRLATPTP